MNDDKKLEETIQQYQAVAKENKNVDVATLMMSALQKTDENKVSGKAKKWAYIVSIGAPPFGLLFALKFYFFDDNEDAKDIAYVCIILTAVSIIGTLLLFKGLFSASGVTSEQIQQIKPSDIMQLTQ